MQKTAEFNYNTDRFTLWLCNDNMLFAFYTAGLAISNKFAINDPLIAARQLARTITPEQIYNELFQRMHNLDALNCELYQGSDNLFGFVLEEQLDWQFPSIVNELSNSRLRFSHCISASELIIDFKEQFPNMEIIYIHTGDSESIWAQDLQAVDLVLGADYTLDKNMELLYNHFSISRRGLILKLTDEWIHLWKQIVI